MEAMQRSVATKVYQDFVPLTEIIEEPQCNTLLVLVYLPECFSNLFANTGVYVRSKISTKFEDLILYITQPKLAASVEKHDQKKPTSSNHDNLTAEKQDEENSSSRKAPKTYKHVDNNEDLNKVKQVSDQKQAEKTDVERKETAKERIEKLRVKGKIFKNFAEDSSDGKTVSDDIPEVQQTKYKGETETGKMNDQKHKTYSWNFSTNMNVQKKVINLVVAILVASAFGLHAYYLVGREKKSVKEDL